MHRLALLLVDSISQDLHGTRTIGKGNETDIQRSLLNGRHHRDGIHRAGICSNGAEAGQRATDDQYIHARSRSRHSGTCFEDEDCGDKNVSNVKKAE